MFSFHLVDRAALGAILMSRGELFSGFAPLVPSWSNFLSRSDARDVVVVNDRCCRSSTLQNRIGLKYKLFDCSLSPKHVALTVGVKKEFGVCCALLRRS